MFTIELWGHSLIFQTHPDLFAPSHPDRGTLAMLRTIEWGNDEKVLDLGCGYGLVGVAAARCIGAERVFLTDIDPRAVELARHNAANNGVVGVTAVCGHAYEALGATGFSLILSNPPYHTDFSVAKTFIEEGYRRLRPEGRMVLVVKRLDWYRNKLTTVFGGVRVREDDGYYVLTAEKRSTARKTQTIRKTTRKHARKTGHQ